MILRKPYAFLIKHFKLMHVILSVCMFYLIYSTSSMIGFINEYIDKTISVVGQDIVSSLFNIGIFLLPILIVIFAAILLFVLTLKSKPRLFYILIIIVYIATLVMFIYANIVFNQMEETIVDMRTVKMLRDLLLYTIVAQTFFSIFSAVRGVGFDIKKFNFNNDLQELEISAEDNEEFEVAIDFDLNDKKRKIKKYIRHSKYWVKEHKLIVGSTLSVVIFGFTIYGIVLYTIVNKTYRPGYKVTANGFTMSVSNSYIVNTDAKGNNITGNKAYLIVVDALVKCNDNKPKSLTVGTLELDIAGEKYYHTDKYDYQLTELGIVYNGQEVANSDTRYLFVFEIPEAAVTSKMKFGIRDVNREKTTYTRLNSKKLLGDKTIKEYKLGDKIDFSDSTLGKTTLKINSYEIKNKFDLRYTYCSPRKRCISSVEYLTPNLFNSNYNKALLKINADFKLDENINSVDVKDIYGLFKTFARIEYEIDGEVKTQNVYLGQVKSQRIKQENTYYIEVFQEIKIAEKITIVFTVRNIEYKYRLK